MLASLLPGLRDVRTPLTVGYIWLLNLWCWLGAWLPSTVDDASGATARLLQLAALVGSPAVLAATGVLAYLLGSIVMIPERGRARTFLERFSRNVEAEKTRREYEANLKVTADELVLHWRQHIDDSSIRMMRDTEGTLLRPRLLVASTELYGEYDRLEAEGTFRINVALPVLALGITLATTAGFHWVAVAALAIVAGIGCAVLVFQGVGRQVAAQSVIQRAVLEGRIEHPLMSFLAEKTQTRSGVLAQRGRASIADG